MDEITPEIKKKLLIRFEIMYMLYAISDDIRYPRDIIGEYMNYEIKYGVSNCHQLWVEIVSSHFNKK